MYEMTFLTTTTAPQHSQVGYTMMVLGLIGPILLGKAGYLWGNAHPESNGAPQGTLSNLPVVHQRLLSACSSNLLIFMMRVILTLSLLYFVQVRAGVRARGREKVGGIIKKSCLAQQYSQP